MGLKIVLLGHGHKDTRKIYKNKGKTPIYDDYPEHNYYKHAICIDIRTECGPNILHDLTKGFPKNVKNIDLIHGVYINYGVYQISTENGYISNIVLLREIFDSMNYGGYFIYSVGYNNYISDISYILTNVIGFELIPYEEMCLNLNLEVGPVSPNDLCCLKKIKSLR